MPYDIIIGRDDDDKKRFGDKGLIYLGKGYVTMGNYTSLSNFIHMDIARSHVVLVSGKRGSGKSYSLGVIAEELSGLEDEVKNNIASLMFDTMGIFWTMKYKNEKEKNLLDEWKLYPKNLPVKVFAPFGFFQEYEERGIPVDEKFAIKVSELNAEDWVLTFNLSITDPISVLIERIVTRLKENEEDFDISDIKEKLQRDKTSGTETKNASLGLFEAAETWGVFSEKGKQGTKINDLITAGTTTIIDLSCYSSVGAFNVRALVIGLVCRKLFNERMLSRKKEEIEAVRQGVDYLSYKPVREMPLVWIFLDECLIGDTEIITSKNHTPIKEIVERFQNKEKFNVFGYDINKNGYGYYLVTNVYKKGKRKIIKLITETGKEIKCTPEHRVLTREGFASAFSVNEIASSLTQHYSEDKKLMIVRLCGHLFGDGWASTKSQSLGFSGKKEPNDLNKIKEDLSKLGFKSSNIHTVKTKSKITNYKNRTVEVNGTSHSIQASIRAFRFFSKLGIPIGDKTINETKIPEWLLNASNEEKAEFLSALMGSDGQIISKAKNAKGDFNAIRLSFHKSVELEKNAFEYAKQIKKLFEDLGIKVSSISKRDGNIRKDGTKTIKLVITLAKNVENTIKFLEKVGYRYCEYKEITGLKWLAYLKARVYVLKTREILRKKALELQKEKNWGKIKISKELKIPDSQVREWIYFKCKAGVPKLFPDFDEWISQRYKDNILFEKALFIENAGEEEVYDISVEGVHNFISNGLITHNCHEFLPREGKTAATDALIQLLREGRQPGISLVLATQQPGQIHLDVMTQSDIVISHRLTAQPDIQALNFIMQTYLFGSIKKYMDELPNLKGSAILLDDNSERIYPIRVRPKFTWHGGESPTAIKVEKRV